jgi:hypothetical protein
MKQLSRLAMVLSAAVVGISATILLFDLVVGRSSELYTLLLGGIAGGLFALYAVVVFRLLTRNPATLTLSIVGHPGTGKTVYLTVLFDQIQRDQDTDIQFAPYGRDTIERVLSDLTTLSQGKWLPLTQLGSVFYYRANVSIGDMPFEMLNTRYKLEIADFAGEYFDELVPSSDRWLHRSEFFKYVVQSQGILLVLDTSALLFQDRPSIEWMQNDLVAAVQVLAESKGATDNKRMETPIALMFTKIDVLPPFQEPKELLHQVPRLVSVCQQRCSNFGIFYVSSVGQVDDPDRPPKMLNPVGVVEPIKWMLKKV